MRYLQLLGWVVKNLQFTGSTLLRFQFQAEKVVGRLLWAHVWLVLLLTCLSVPLKVQQREPGVFLHHYHWHCCAHIYISHCKLTLILSQIWCQLRVASTIYKIAPECIWTYLVLVIRVELLIKKLSCINIWQYICRKCLYQYQW